MGKGCRRAVNQGHSRLYEADLGLILDFAREGVLAPAWAPEIRSLNKKRPWTWGPEYQWARQAGPSLQLAPPPCNSNSMWKCPRVPLGLLLSGVGASTLGGGGEGATICRPAGASTARPRMARLLGYRRATKTECTGL